MAKPTQTPRSGLRLVLGAGGLTLVLLVICVILLVLSEEFFATRHQQRMSAVAREVLSVSADRIDPGNEGRYVLVSGNASASKAIIDPVFGIESDGLSLRRIVHMYRRQAVVGSRPQRYETIWSATDTTPVMFENFVAPVMLGAFTLPRSLIDRLDAEPLHLVPSAEHRTAHGRALKILEDVAYIGADPRHPQVGDLRVTWLTVRAGVVTVMARQKGSGFAEYPADADPVPFLIKPGRLSAEQMLKGPVAP